MYALRRRAMFAPLVLFAVTLVQPRSAAAKFLPQSSPSSTTQSSTASKAKAAQGAPDDSNKLDINTATSDQLKALPGIGDAYAARIIGGRPYTAKNQLTTKGVLPQATYDKIKNQIVAHKAAAAKK